MSGLVQLGLDYPEPRLISNQREASEFLARIQRQPIGFDVETSGVSPESEFIHDDFPLITDSRITGFSISLGEDPRDAAYFPCRHLHGGNLPTSVWLAALRRVAEHTDVWMHNAKYDLTMVEKEGIWIRNYRCSQVAAWMCNASEHGYGLKKLVAQYYPDEAYGKLDNYTQGKSVCELVPKDIYRYAALDAMFALRFGLRSLKRLKAWGLVESFMDTEMTNLNVLRKMELRGMRFDVEAANEVSRICSNEISKLESWWNKAFPEVSPYSTKQLQILFEDGVWPLAGMDRTKTGQFKLNKFGCEKIAAQLDTGSLGDKAMRVFVDLKKYSKLRSAFAETLPARALWEPDMRIRGSYHQTGTRTSRYSSSSPNQQQVPVRSELGMAIKGCFTGPLYSADYSQIELRVLAHLSGDEQMLSAFREGRDIHQATADIVGCTRNGAKALNFAIIYGAGPAKVAQMAKISEDAAKDLLDLYPKRFPAVGQWKDDTVKQARRNGYVATLSGFRRLLPNIGHSDKSLRGKDERRAVNTVVQGSAAYIVKLAMNDLDAAGFPLVAQVHDEVVSEPYRSLEEFQAILGSAYDLGMPLSTDAIICEKSWAESKSK